MEIFNPLVGRCFQECLSREDNLKICFSQQWAILPSSESTFDFPAAFPKWMTIWKSEKSSESKIDQISYKNDVQENSSTFKNTA